MPRGPKPAPGVTTPGAHRPWIPAAGTGWRWGDIPAAPEFVSDRTKAAWADWFGSWWAGFWCPEDVPGLELTAKLYDGAMCGHIDVAKAAPMLDRYGITPKGRQDLRWAEPVEKVEPDQSQTPDEVEERRQRRAAQVS